MSGAKTGGSRPRHIQIAGRKEKKKDAFRTCEADVVKEQKRLKTEDKEEERTVNANRAHGNKHTHDKKAFYLKTNSMFSLKKKRKKKQDGWRK